MNTRDQLNQYLQGLEKRMRWLAVSKAPRSPPVSRWAPLSRWC